MTFTVAKATIPSSLSVTIRKWWILVHSKARANLHPQESSAYSEEYKKQERRRGPKDAIYGWALYTTRSCLCASNPL